MAHMVCYRWQSAPGVLLARSVSSRKGVSKAVAENCAYAMQVRVHAFATRKGFWDRAAGCWDPLFALISQVSREAQVRLPEVWLGSYLPGDVMA